MRDLGSGHGGGWAGSDPHLEICVFGGRGAGRVALLGVGGRHGCRKAASEQAPGGWDSQFVFLQWISNTAVQNSPGFHIIFLAEHLMRLLEGSSTGPEDAAVKLRAKTHSSMHAERKCLFSLCVWFGRSWNSSKTHLYSSLLV